MNQDIKKRLFYFFVLLTVAVVTVFGVSYLVELFEAKKIEKDEREIDSIFKTGLLYYNNSQLDSAFTYFKIARDSCESENKYHLRKHRPKINYWCAKTYYDLYGFEEIDGVNYYLKRIFYPHDPVWASKALYFKADVYEKEFDFKNAEKAYLKCIEEAKENNDSLLVIQALSKTLAFYERKEDRISPNFLIALNRHYFASMGEKALNSEASLLLISEALLSLSYSNENMFIGANVRNENIVDSIDAIIIEKFDPIIDSSVLGRVYRNIGLFLKRAAYDTSKQEDNKLVLLHSATFYRRGSDLLKRFGTQYDYNSCLLGLSNTYFRLDSLNGAINVLNQIDTSIVTLSQKLKIELMRSDYALGTGDNNLAVSILKNADQLSQSYEQFSEYEKVKLIESKIAIKQELRDLDNLRKGSKIDNEIINLQSIVADYKEENILKDSESLQEAVADVYGNIKEILFGSEGGSNIVNYAFIFFIIFGVFGFILVSFLVVLYIFYMKTPEFLKKRHMILPGNILVQYQDIMYIRKEARRNKVWYHLKDGRVVYEYTSISSLLSGNSESKRKPLPATIFTQINQSYVLNIFEYKEMLKGSEGIRLKNDEILPISIDSKDSVLPLIVKRTTNPDLVTSILTELRFSLERFVSSLRDGKQ